MVRRRGDRSTSGKQRKGSSRRLAFEPLGARQLLSASPLVVGGGGNHGAPVPYRRPGGREQHDAFGLHARPNSAGLRLQPGDFSGVKGDGSGQTIAIVDAYDDPNIAADLKVFDKQFGLPDPKFTKVNLGGAGR